MGDKRERGKFPFSVRGGDRLGENSLPIRGGIKVGEGKRELVGIALGVEGEGVWHLAQLHRPW